MWYSSYGLSVAWEAMRLRHEPECLGFVSNIKICLQVYGAEVGLPQLQESSLGLFSTTTAMKASEKAV